MKQNNIILFDVPAVRENLLPLSYTRPVADFLVGITTLRRKWEAFMEGVFSYYTAPYLMEKYPMLEAEENIFIASNVIATRDMARAVEALEPGECLVGDSACRLPCHHRAERACGGFAARTSRVRRREAVCRQGGCNQPCV